MGTRRKLYGEPDLDVVFSFAKVDNDWISMDTPVPGPAYLASVNRRRWRPYPLDKEAVQDTNLDSHIEELCRESKLCVVLLSKAYAELWGNQGLAEVKMPVDDMKENRILLLASIDGTEAPIRPEHRTQEWLDANIPVLDLSERGPDALGYAMLESLGLRRHSAFISYRRSDSELLSNHIHESLVREFGPAKAFIDRAMWKGDAYPDRLWRALEISSVLLTIIGPDWLSVCDGRGRRRLDDEHDWVRREVTYALERRLPTIPVLIGGAKMPAEADLPPEIRTLAHRNYIELRDSSWEADLRELHEAVSNYVRADRHLAERGSLNLRH